MQVNKFALFLLKLSISGALLYLLLSKIGGRAIVENIRLLPPGSFAAAVALYAVACYISSVRWKLLIPMQFTTRRLFSLYMIGSFFNTYLPGIIGGDGVKAYYLSRELRGRGALPAEAGSDRGGEGRLSLDRLLMTENIVAVASVFMDRYMGLFALLFISLAALPFSMKYLESAAGQWPVVWAVPLLYVVLFALSVLVFRFRIGGGLRVLQKAYDYMHLYGSRWRILAATFLYSLAIQIISIVSVYILSQGLALNLPLLALLIYVPLIVLISFIPVSISGLGIREGAFVLLLSTMGVPADLAVTLSLLWFLSIVTASSWGFVEYLRHRAALSADGESG